MIKQYALGTSLHKFFQSGITSSSLTHLIHANQGPEQHRQRSNAGLAMCCKHCFGTGRYSSRKPTELLVRAIRQHPSLSPFVELVECISRSGRLSGLSPASRRMDWSSETPSSGLPLEASRKRRFTDHLCELVHSWWQQRVTHPIADERCKIERLLHPSHIVAAQRGEYPDATLARQRARGTCSAPRARSHPA